MLVLESTEFKLAALRKRLEEAPYGFVEDDFTITGMFVEGKDESMADATLDALVGKRVRIVRD